MKEQEDIRDLSVSDTTELLKSLINKQPLVRNYSDHFRTFLSNEFLFVTLSEYTYRTKPFLLTH